MLKLTCLFGAALAIAGITSVTGCSSVPTTAVVPSGSGNIAYALAGPAKGGAPVVVPQSGLGDGKSPWADVRTRYDLAEQGGFETMVHRYEPDWLRLAGASSIESVAQAVTR